MVCPGPRSLLPVADVHAGSLRDKAGTAAWLLHVVGATALAHPTGVVLLWPSARMFCDAPCHLQSLVVCHLSVLGSCAGARTCDEQGPKHGPEQELLLVCRRPRLIG